MDVIVAGDVEFARCGSGDRKETTDEHAISWTTKVRYLDIYVLSSRVFKCSLHYAKCGFYRAANAVFGKVCRVSSEEVVLQRIKSECLHCLEVCPLTKTI